MRRTLIVLATAIAAATPAAADYLVKEVGSFHIGGRTETLNGLASKEIVFSPGAPPIKVDPNGEFEVEQMYVQFVKLAQPKSKLPLLLWHGGGLSGATWETKPDGKPGWQQFFLNAGYDVYVSDAVERGRASWARYPEIFKSEPFFRPKKEAWELFRIGPSYEVGGKREAFEGEQFPIEAFDQFAKQGIPRWATNDTATQKAYDALVQKVCPCIIVVHSQGGNFGFTAALNAPDKVKALIAVEPSGAPDPAKADAAKLKGVPHLIVWGDFLDKVSVWSKLVVNPTRWGQAIAATGGKVDTFELPKMGIKGNTHMMMMDRNSDDIARLVNDWIGKQGLAN
ncbi:esterase [Bradyrhizobium zhanjiangense]|uniref:Esterase n=1 Tax=Bradyrhizobium zhanjiangense TaxID=1325107 RepID=A0ABY0DA11_9BRAD|nr:esterase [Bradyrhizobium zhanjiangense]RXG87506.1 esterase [Bradyrhizobium zhanjiangense]